MSFVRKCDSCGKMFDLTNENILGTIRFTANGEEEIFELCSECFEKHRAVLPKECVTSNQIGEFAKLIKNLATLKPITPAYTPCYSDNNSQLFSLIYDNR